MISFEDLLILNKINSTKLKYIEDKVKKYEVKGKRRGTTESKCDQNVRMNALRGLATCINQLHRHL